MNVYYKIIGHLEDDEQETGTFIFNNEQPIPNIEKMFKSQLLEECGYDSDSNKEVSTLIQDYIKKLLQHEVDCMTDSDWFTDQIYKAVKDREDENGTD